MQTLHSRNRAKMKRLSAFKNILPEYISAVFIFLFGYTAVNKLLHAQAFRHSLEQSPLLQPYAAIIAWLIPVTETAIALLLLFAVSRLAGLYATFLLMATFTLYVGYMIVYIPKLPCSCGGIIQALSWKQHLFLNIFLTLLAFAAIMLQRGWLARRQVLIKPAVN
jgi:hypothetical protein